MESVVVLPGLMASLKTYMHIWNIYYCKQRILLHYCKVKTATKLVHQHSLCVEVDIGADISAIC